jgi:hypothetical protein
MRSPSSATAGERSISSTAPSRLWRMMYFIG